MNQPPLKSGGYYHIYNRANGSEDLFRDGANYQHFLQLYDKYIAPVADTFAWVLMPNHFHLVVRIKGGVYYKYSKEDFSIGGNADRFAHANTVGLPANVRFGDVKWKTTTVNPSASPGPDGVNRKKPNPTNHFSHLFNAYAKYINKKYGRHGSLFQRPFKRKAVSDDNYLKRLVLYIHSNPVHHGFVRQPEDYPWSSYHTFFSKKPAKLQREAVWGWFAGLTNFRNAHRDRFDPAPLEAWLDDDGIIKKEMSKNLDS